MLGVSVVIPARNRLPALRACVRSVIDSHRRLKELHPHYREFEIIVVDDRSSDNLSVVSDEFPNVVVAKSPGGGPGAARNAGIELARHDVIGFTDSDCVADKDWLCSFVRMLENDSVLAVQGDPTLFQKIVNPLLGACEERLYRCMWASYIDGSRCQQIDSRNFAIKKQLMRHLGVGLFSEEMGTAQAEARVAGLRLIKAGIEIRYEPKMKVYHEDPKSIFASMRQKKRHGSGRIYVWEQPPPLSLMMQRYFLKPILFHRVPFWYVLPTHAAFLWGYMRAR